MCNLQIAPTSKYIKLVLSILIFTLFSILRVKLSIIVFSNNLLVITLKLE